MKKSSEPFASLSDQLVKHESDRGAVLVGLAALDEELEILLRATFVQDYEVVKTSVELLFGTNGPLHTFWAKSHFAYALGITPKPLFTDLEKLRKLRNRFAHQKLPVDFNDKEVKDLIDGLSTALEYGQHMKGKRYNLSDKGDKALQSFGLSRQALLNTIRAAFRSVY